MDALSNLLALSLLLACTGCAPQIIRDPQGNIRNVQIQTLSFQDEARPGAERQPEPGPVMPADWQRAYDRGYQQGRSGRLPGVPDTPPAPVVIDKRPEIIFPAPAALPPTSAAPAKPTPKPKSKSAAVKPAGESSPSTPTIKKDALGW